MDWMRAKNILLVAFLLLNLFLGYRIWGSEILPGYNRPFTPEQVEEVKERLLQARVTLESEIPAAAPSLPFLMLSYPTASKEALFRLFFPGVTDISAAELGRPGPVVYSRRREQLIVDDTGVIYYLVSAERVPGARVDPSRALALAERFILAHGGFPPSARLDFVQYDPQHGRYAVEYGQHHDGYPIFGGRISVGVGPSGVESFSRTWFSPRGYSGQSKPVIPAIEALLRLVNYLDPREQQAIEEIKLGYYSPDYPAVQWQAVPVWRVRTRRGSTYYINAYTGELERGVVFQP